MKTLSLIVLGILSFCQSGLAIPFATSQVQQVVHATTFPKSVVSGWLEESLTLGDVPGLPSDQHIVFFIFDDVSGVFLGNHIPTTLPYKRFFVGIPYVKSTDQRISPNTNFFYMPIYHVSRFIPTLFGRYPWGLNKYLTDFQWDFRSEDNHFGFSFSKAIDSQSYGVGAYGEILKDRALSESSNEAFKKLTTMMNQPAIGFIHHTPMCSAMTLQLNSAVVKPVRADWYIEGLKLNNGSLNNKSLKNREPLTLTNGIPQGSYMMNADFVLSLPTPGCHGF